MIKLHEIKNNLLLEAQQEQDKQEFEDTFEKLISQDLATAIENAADELKDTPQDLNEDEPLYIAVTILGNLLTINAVSNLVAKIAEWGAKKLNWKQGEDFAHKAEHFTHTIEKGIIDSMADALRQLIIEIHPNIDVDSKLLERINKSAKVLYAIIVIKMALSYGAEAMAALGKTRWGKGLLTLVKTFAKTKEGAHNIKPLLQKAAKITRLARTTSKTLK